MDKYGKIFRKYTDDGLSICIETYNPDKKKYHEVISDMKLKGFKQVIINSEIMVKILNLVIQNGEFILGIDFTESTDEYIDQKVRELILKIRHNPLIFIELKKLLDWTLDNNSIDIARIELFFRKEKIEIYSNGQVIGEDINTIFTEIIEKVLQEYIL